jgi:hypothetical protein
VWITDDVFIDEAIALETSGESPIPSFDDLLDGKDCDSNGAGTSTRRT